MLIDAARMRQRNRLTQRLRDSAPPGTGYTQ